MSHNCFTPHSLNMCQVAPNHLGVVRFFYILEVMVRTAWYSLPQILFVNFFFFFLQIFLNTSKSDFICQHTKWLNFPQHIVQVVQLWHPKECEKDVLNSSWSLIYNILIVNIFFLLMWLENTLFKVWRIWKFEVQTLTFINNISSSYQLNYTYKTLIVNIIFLDQTNS